MDIVITGVEERDDDILRVTGTIDGHELHADGWQSATTNHYDLDTYQDDGHRRPDALPREMTEEERDAYYRLLLIAAYKEWLV